MEEKQTITIPEAPALLPSSVKAEWRRAYASESQRLAGDDSLSDSDRRQGALREANRLLRVPEVESYQEAQRLAEWQVVHREVRDGQLKVVTIDGHKYSFPVPAGAERRAAE
jgi:hypothetical protein